MTICAVLNEYLSDVILPNTAELLGLYGRVCCRSGCWRCFQSQSCIYIFFILFLRCALTVLTL